MKRKLLLSSTVLPVLLASGAMAQVVNFHDADNNASLTGFIGECCGDSYNELFAGQGAYSDPGNDIWNGFGATGAYGNGAYYSGGFGSGTPWPLQYGNPGNPYAAYSASYNAAAGWTSSTGTSLISATDWGLPSSGPTINGNSTSGAQFTQVTLLVGGYGQDSGDPTGRVPGIQNGTPSFLMLESAENSGDGSNEVFTLQDVPAGTNTYGLFLYGANFNNNAGTLFSVSSGSPHNGIAATLNGQNGAPAATFVEGQNFVIFENVSADVNSNITITASPNPQAGVGNSNVANEIDVNGFQLIFNPPPTALGCTAAQNVWAGGTANFSFSPVFAPSPAFQWQSIIGGVTNDLSDSGTISGSGTTSLTIIGVSSNNVGLYQCVISTATATNTSPAAPLTLLTSTATGPVQAGDSNSVIGDILQPGDSLSDFNSTNSFPYNTIPPAFNMLVNSVEDNALNQYESFGSNASVAPFAGPVGFTVTPNAGASIVTGMRLFASSGHPEDDPADFLLQGSNDGGNTFTPIVGGLLALPPQRNAAGGPINITNQVLQELDFTNTTAYATYQLTFTNVNNDEIASNGVEIAEIQFLGSLAALKPGIVRQPESLEVVVLGGMLNASVVASGPGPLGYQWYYNTAQAIAGATNASFTLTNLQATNSGSYTCVITNSYGSTNSTALNVVYSFEPTFNTNGSGWTMTNNGVSPAQGTFITNNVIELTDTNYDEITSFFFDTPMYIGAFKASFIYTDVGSDGVVNDTADGFTFCFQNSPAGASDLQTGAGGSGIGYYQMTNSTALATELYDNQNDNGPGIAIATNGQGSLGVLGGGYLYGPTGNVSVISGDGILYDIFYDGNNFNVTLTDTNNPSETYTTNYVVGPLSAAVGGDSAFIGFTAATGGVWAVQTIANFSFTPIPMLSAAESGGNVVVSWPTAIGGYSLQQSSNIISTNWTTVPGPFNVVSNQYQNVVTSPTSNQFFRLVAP
jgi:hypothetical protein